MRTKKIEKYFIYYRPKNKNYYFVECSRICKYPERTKEYKMLKDRLNSSFVDAIGWCTIVHIEDYKNQFINIY